MSENLCPVCGKAPLGSPYMFQGEWLAACRACHTEIRVLPAGGAGDRASGFVVPEASAGADLYRRRTPF